MLEWPQRNGMYMRLGLDLEATFSFNISSWASHSILAANNTEQHIDSIYERQKTEV
jgi:hypothetical protein